MGYQMKRLKKVSIVIFLFIIALAGYTLYANRNTNNMTSKQKILKAFYPALMWVTKITGTNAANISNKNAMASVSFYSIAITANNGSGFDLAALKGKKVLLVNTASNCGYTDQYAELEKLYQQYKGQLEILAFPANDFKEQEKAGDADIAQFCKINYGVSFPIMAKSVVIKSSNQNAVFNWLTNPSSNGWNSKAPSWNFSKYLVNENGQFTHYFDPSISPLSKEVTDAIAEK
jgi:glutathione peroxidase